MLSIKVSALEVIAQVHLGMSPGPLCPVSAVPQSRCRSSVSYSSFLTPYPTHSTHVSRDLCENILGLCKESVSLSSGTHGPDPEFYSFRFVHATLLPTTETKQPLAVLYSFFLRVNGITRRANAQTIHIRHIYGTSLRSFLFVASLRLGTCLPPLSPSCFLPPSSSVRV